MICVNVAEGKVACSSVEPGHPVGPNDRHAQNSLASISPAVDCERRYGGLWDCQDEGISLHAFDLAGKPLWSKPLGNYVSQHGPGCSPMVYKGLVYVNVDDDKHAELIAFDAKSGERK